MTSHALHERSPATLDAARLVASISRLHIVGIASAAALTFGWVFTGRYLWLVAGVCGLDWLLVNLLNRVVDLEEDTANRITGTGFVARHRRGITAAGFALLASSLVGVQALAPQLMPLRLAFHALGLAYNWPLLPGRRRIKQLYFFKNAASATGFMLTVFAYPLAAAGWLFGDAPLAAGITPATVLAAAAFFFLFELSYEVLYDLRDVEGDRLAGARTYPVVHGERAAVWIVNGLVAAATAVLVLGYALEVVPWRLTIMAVAPLTQLAYARWALRRGLTAGDCILLTWLGAAMLVTYNLWVWGGLPGAGS